MDFKKGEFLAEEGEKCQNVYLIREGIVRTYVMTPAGEARTIRLAREGDFSTANQSFLYGLPSTENLEALLDCKVIAVNIEKLRELEKENVRILRVSHEGLKEAFSEIVGRIEMFTTLTPEQHYSKLLEESPDLIQRVPQKYLASYLGITTVSLSRIRNRKQ